MTEEMKLETWEAFEKEIEKELVEDKILKEQPLCYVPDLLFRGHANKDWRLLTTLERFSQDKQLDDQVYSEKDYYYILRSVLPAISSLTSEKYELPEFESGAYSTPTGYEFMIYIRHHGFPSPLLDWTESPYVAAFFAFSESKECDDVAIYSYRTYKVGGKGGFLGTPQINQLGPYAQTHERHYTQRCQYTICTKVKEKEKVYCSHEDVNFGDDQDVLKKYIISGKERKKALEKLDFMNIHAFSLFRNEEGLMSTLAYREIEKKGDVSTSSA